MKMNRRNALLGLGAIATGGGALFGSGAFSNVEADRTVTLSVTGDASANLTFEAGSGATEIIGNEAADSGGNTIISFTDSGLNDDATTLFRDALRVTNTGDQAVGFYVREDTGGTADVSSSGTLNFEDESSTTIVQSDPGSGVSANLTLDASGGDDTELIDVIVDATQADPANLPGTVTFVADSDNS